MVQREHFKTVVFFAAVAAVLFSLLPACVGQTATPKKRSPPKPEPTAAELSEYIRGALISLSPEDGVNDNLEVKYDLATNVMTVTQPGGHCDDFWGSLNANQVVWDDFDPSDSRNSRERLARVTLVSISGKPARKCYDNDGEVDETIGNNRVRLVFSFTKADQRPKFQELMTKAIKKLIALSGGDPEHNIF